MIPQRIQLQGFLSYKEKQEVRFDDAPLWMLAGVNGSGKSSIFDAVTYALFGWHRGGQREADQLINKDSDGLAVEFDFLLDGQEYRAKRTLRRSARGATTVTQQILRRAGNGNGDGGWQPVEGTKQKREFDTWVQEHIGLTYETFTSSVLLLQGKAEKLLDSTAKGRFEVLASIVDLDRYKRLWDRADGQRKELEREDESLKLRLAGLPEVDASQMAEADEHITVAEKARTAAQDDVERFLGLESQARQWVELRKKLADLDRRWQEAHRLLADATDIDKDLNRLRELRVVLSPLETIAKQRRDLSLSEQKTKDLTSQREKLAERVAELDHALQQTRHKRGILQERIADDERRHREASALLLEATALQEKLNQYERHEKRLTELQGELGRLPADPAAALARAQAAHDELVALDRAVPLLARLQSLREELRQARHREQSAAQTRETVQARGKQLGVEVEALKPKVEQAEGARRQADDKAAEARTLLQQARQQLQELSELEGAKVCRHCGQALTPGHVEEEQRRRTRELGDAEAHFQVTSKNQMAAREQEQRLREEFGYAEKQLLEARGEFRDAQTESRQAQQDIERLQRECGQVYHELAEPFRTPVGAAPPADWLATVYPTADEVTIARQQAAGLPRASQQLREAQSALSEWKAKKAMETDLRQTLGQFQAELPADRLSVRSQFVRAQAETQTLAEGLTARQREREETQRQLDRLAQEREHALAKSGSLDGDLKREEATRQHGQQALTRAMKELPAVWQAIAERAGLAELHALSGERDALIAAQTDERGVRLQQARVGADLLEKEKADLQAREQAFVPEARQEPARLQEQLVTARQAQRAREEELRRAHLQRDSLERDRQQRQQLLGDCLQLERELAIAKTLAELLGRDRLQLHLVRQAERQVVDHANAVLDRLSGGQLCLRLCGEAGGEDNATKALELEAYNRVTGEKPINVAFLSGSQRFRVAVSLALGIGQYASRQHRPIESVIIDEGFGCLDRQGRQVMIQELQNLRGQMRCILLVSHQEEFADAFADGYRFELADGATKVTRFQR